MKGVTTNRPLRELVAEAKAEVMEEIEDNREEGEEDDPAELPTVRQTPLSFTTHTRSLFQLLCLSEGSDEGKVTQGRLLPLALKNKNMMTSWCFSCCQAFYRSLAVRVGGVERGSR